MMEHVSVLLHETIDALAIKPDGIYVDGTLGRGGHSLEVVKRLTTGHLYAFDKDVKALEESAPVFQDWKERITMIHADFSHMRQELQDRGVESVDGIMMDLGVSSPQFDDPTRGFSYRFDARLDMRMDQSQSLDAYQVVNGYGLEELIRILREYGEERYAYPIAKAICKARQQAPIETTLQLVEVIKSALPNALLRQKGHPAKQSFQALRIEVNHELDALQEALEMGTSLLKSKGRMAIITFHSLEDRLVKTYFKTCTTIAQPDPRLPIKAQDMEQASFRLVTRKAIIAQDEELAQNHRAHSAKLRVIEKK